MRQPAINSDRKSFEASLSLEHNPVPIPSRKRNKILKIIIHGHVGYISVSKYTYMRRRRTRPCKRPHADRKHSAGE